MEGRIYVEEWQAHYGTPLHIDTDVDALAGGELVEDHVTGRP